MGSIHVDAVVVMVNVYHALRFVGKNSNAETISASLLVTEANVLLVQ